MNANRYEIYMVNLSRDGEGLLPESGDQERNLTGVTVEMGGMFRTNGPAWLAEQHADTNAPLEWCNWVHVEFDRENDAIMLNISVGDIRGAFQVMLARHRYHDDETDRDVDELRMTVPHPDDAAPHVPLHPIHERGYYRLGH